MFGPCTGHVHRENAHQCLVHLGGNLSGAGPIRLQDKQRVIDKLVAEGKTPHADVKTLWDKRTSAYHLVNRV